MFCDREIFVDNEPMKNEQPDKDVLQGMEDGVRDRPEVNEEQAGANSKKLIPSFEDIVAGQEENADATGQEPAAIADGGEETGELVEVEEGVSISQIPHFKLTEQILSEQRKMTAGRRRRPSSGTQAGDRTDVCGILGEVVRADRAERSRIAKALAISTDGVEEKISDELSESFHNIKLTPAVYNILKGESGLTQFQREIISDIVMRDIAEYGSN